MKYFLSVFLTFLLFSCSKTEKREQPFDSFVYSYATINLEYVVKLTNSDTIYFQKRSPKPKTTSYAIMEQSQRNNIIALIKKIDYTKYKGDYIQQTLVDGVGFRFEAVKDDKIKSINVYGDNAPKELYAYAAKFNELIKHLNFNPYNGKVSFEDLMRPEIPILPAPKSEKQAITL